MNIGSNKTFSNVDDHCLIMSRRELDLQDTLDKYPEGFQVSFDVVVSATDRPRVEQMSLPWEGFTAKGLGSKILFSSKQEQQQLAAEFGTFNTDYIMIISIAQVKRAGPKPVIQCVLDAEQHVGIQVTGLLTSR